MKKFRIRKKTKIMLAAVSMIFGMAAPLYSLDFSIEALGSCNFLSDPNFNNGFSGSLGMDLELLKPRRKDSLFVAAKGSLFELAGKNIDSLFVYDGTFGLGYEFKIMDRLSVNAEAGAGVWFVPEDESKGIRFARGYSFYGQAGTEFYFLPELSVKASVGYKQYYNEPQSLSQGITAGIGIRYSFGRGIFGKSAVKWNEDNVQKSGLFPVFYSRYDDHSFGYVSFTNNEPNDIQDVKITVFIEKYMTTPSVCAEFKSVKLGETFEAELTAFLDEAMLNNITPSNADAKVCVEYTSLGKRMSVENTIILDVYGRNSMTWEDDRRAAAFVSSHDGAARFFAKQVKAVMRNRLTSNTPENIQYAEALFNVLKAYGINYVIDPASAFVDNEGSAAVDFLQYPYQTLLYHGGDCDDLSILNAALLESIGIETAFITLPGHIFIAFDSGVQVAQKNTVANHIVMYDKVWVPVEITMCQDSFSLARKVAIAEWNKYPDERSLIPLSEAWKEYPAVGIPDSDVLIEMPSIIDVVR